LLPSFDAEHWILLPLFGRRANGHAQGCRNALLSRPELLLLTRFARRAALQLDQGGSNDHPY